MRVINALISVVLLANVVFYSQPSKAETLPTPPDGDAPTVTRGGGAR